MLPSSSGRCAAASLRVVCTGDWLPRSWRRSSLLKIQHLPSPWPSCHRTYTSEATPLRKQLKEGAKRNKGISAGSRSRKQENKATSGWEVTVGIEIHAQLNTSTKLFSEANTSFNALPNSKAEPFDVALPGTQPHFQIATLLPALRAAVALQCSIQPMSRFDRKHYFYHDQPAGYQITQYYEPFARDGEIKLTTEDGIPEPLNVKIKQIQMEQDTAKSQEQDEETILMDFNRSGLPLIEIISMPDIHSPEAASAFVRKIQLVLLSVNAVTAGMEQGGLRADVNVSVRRKDGGGDSNSYGGVGGLGQRTEIKNLSTFKAVEDAVRAEMQRQISVLEAGGKVEGETRGWSLARPNETRRLRGKEGEVDYRYMPDPDIAPVYIGHDLIDHIRDTLPALPDQLFEMLTKDTRYGLCPTDAKILLQADAGDRLDFYQETVDIAQQLAPESRTIGKLVGNWLLQEIGHALTTRNRSWDDSMVTPSQLANLVSNVLKKQITGTTAKYILGRFIDGDQRTVDQVIEDEGLRLVPLDAREYEKLAQEAVATYPEIVREIQKTGKTGKVMYLVGQILRRGPEGRVVAKVAEDTLRALILPTDGR